MATLTSGNLPYPLPGAAQLLLPTIILISCELFRLASAEVPQRYSEQMDYCVTLMGKGKRKVEPQQ